MKLLLKNATIFDGAEFHEEPADVLIDGASIGVIGRLDHNPDIPEIDGAGLVAAPAFIDIHSHCDLQVLENRPEKTQQGVTTEVVGNCGFSAFPCSHDRQALHEFGNGVLSGSGEWGWTTARAYLDEVERRAGATNVLTLVGHGSLRIAVAGNRQGPLEPAELDQMEALLDESLAAGAAGLSTGLMYAPGSGAPREELERLCRVVARHDRIYTSHMRSYSWELLDSIEEQLSLARATGCRLQISHLQAVGRANWEKQGPALELLEQARRDGIDVEFDIYPYTAGSTVLTQLLPQEALDGGMEAMIARLRDRELRRRLLNELRTRTAQQWSDILISAVDTATNRHVVGKSIAAIAAERNREPEETVLDLLEQESGNVNIISFNQSEENLRALLTHPLCTVISDGFYTRGKPHPRLYGTFPTFLGEMSRRRGWLPLRDALYKITRKPAERFRMRKLGCLQPGYAADIVLFDAGRIDSPATYDQPDLPPTGISAVFRGGKPVFGGVAA